MERKIYFITGLGCSGKSTFANELGKQLNLPVYHADDVYFLVKDKLGITQEELLYLPMFSTWESKYDWKEYKTPEALLEICYNEFFSYNPPNQFILEGEALFFNEREQALVQKMFVGYNKRYILIQPDYEQWLKLRSKRELQSGEHLPPFREESDFYSLQKYLERATGTNSLFRIKDFPFKFSNPTGGTDYQTEEFSEPKWKVFDFPNLKGKTFLDVSCNTGWFCRHAFEQGAEVTGLDINWQALDIAMDYVGGEFIHSKIEDWHPTKKYDYVLCSSAFHYYHKREEQIRKLSEITNYLILELPIIDTDEELIRYQGGEDNEFCSVVSRGLIEKWLKKYFKKVEKIGETHQFTGSIDNTRPVYRCTK